MEKLELTGKCKEEFEKWYELNHEAIVLRSIDDEFIAMIKSLNTLKL